MAKNKSKKSKKAPKKKLSPAALKKKRSIAAKKGWVTRRKVAHTRDKHHIKHIADLEDKIRAQEERLKGLEYTTQEVTTRFKHYIALDNLPPRLINESALEHAGRIIKALKLASFNADQAYSAVASHTGLNPREIYTMFMYVGPGEFVA